MSERPAFCSLHAIPMADATDGRRLCPWCLYLACANLWSAQVAPLALYTPRHSQSRATAAREE
jgi:hypothetical protein